MKLKINLLFLAMLLYNGCAYNEYNPDVCFQENILPIFVSKCSMNGCHDGANSSSDGESKDYRTYDGIIKDIIPNHPLQSEIYRAIKGNNPKMPIGGKLSIKEVSYIEIWIRMGAKNTNNCYTCDTSNIAYTLNVKPIFTNWCVGCHNPTNKSGGYDFSVYSGIVTSITNIRLSGSIKHLSGYTAMPTVNKLSDCDIKIIDKWIQAGYPNN